MEHREDEATVANILLPDADTPPLDAVALVSGVLYKTLTGLRRATHAEQPVRVYELGIRAMLLTRYLARMVDMIVRDIPIPTPAEQQAYTERMTASRLPRTPNASRRAQKTDHDRVRHALREAVRTGRVIKPTLCQGCGNMFPVAEIQAHHYRYDDPFACIWLCHTCHRRLHGSALPSDE